MHDSEKVVVHLGSEWTDCPMWWRNMVRNLSETHAARWTYPKSRVILTKYLLHTYSADYHDSPDVVEATVEFPDQLSYYECVLHWS